MLLKNITVLDSPASNVDYALKSKFKDIEDGMQYDCAKANNCNIILTRDIKDFKESEIPITTPQSFLKEVRSN